MRDPCTFLSAGLARIPVKTRDNFSGCNVARGRAVGRRSGVSEVVKNYIIPCFPLIAPADLLIGKRNKEREIEAHDMARQSQECVVGFGGWDVDGEIAEKIY